MHRFKAIKTMSGSEITRREFLKIVGSSSLLFTFPLTEGCQEWPQATFPVSLVKDPDDSYAINRAIELVGGLDFLTSADSVLLKLALNSSNPFPATTSPVVVSELIALLKNWGAGDIFVGDRSPARRDTIKCMQETGIYQAVIDAGAEVVVFEDEDMVQAKPEHATHWPEGFSIPDLFNQVDHIIALPRLSTHSLAGFTMGIKIFVGALHPASRVILHTTPNFLEKLSEISLGTDKIRLSLLDARKGFSSGGPDTGTLITPGIIIASKSLVAADVVGLALLKAVGTTSDLMNTRVWDHPMIKRGVEVHSPSLSFETIELEWDGIENIDEIEEQLK